MCRSDKGNRRLKSASPALFVLPALCLLLSALSHAAVVNIKLNGPLAPDDDVADFKISPDGQWVVYRAGKSNTVLPPEPFNEAHNLFSVPIEGGAPIQLNGLLPANSTVKFDYAISSDSRWVVYRAEQDEQDKVELYSVPIEGPAGSGVKLNIELPSSGSVIPDGLETQLGFRISPDGSRVVYVASQDSLTSFELYSVPIQGPAANGAKLSGTLQGFWDIVGDTYRISPNGLWVVYEARQDFGEGELYSVPIDGPSSSGVKINGLLVPFGYIVGRSIEISPDSRRVVYVAQQQTVGVSELYSVPIRGPASAGVTLNGALPSGSHVFTFRISPDSRLVTYTADQRTSGLIELFSVPIEGRPGGGQRISHDLLANDDVSFWPIEFSPDSSRVFYFEASNGDKVRELFTTPVSGPPEAALKLNKPLPSGGTVFEFQTASGVERVVYMAEQDADNAWELFSVPIDGPSSAAIQLNQYLGPGGDVHDFAVSPDGRDVAFLADRVSVMGLGDDEIRLFLTSASGGGNVIRLHGPLVQNGDVLSSFEFTPDSKRVVYIADQDTDNVNELYVSYDRPAAARGWPSYE